MNNYVDYVAATVALVSIIQLVWAKRLITVVRAGFILVATSYAVYLLR